MEPEPPTLTKQNSNTRPPIPSPQEPGQQIKRSMSKGKPVPKQISSSYSRGKSATQQIVSSAQTETKQLDQKLVPLIPKVKQLPPIP